MVCRYDIIGHRTVFVDRLCNSAFLSSVFRNNIITVCIGTSFTRIQWHAQGWRSLGVIEALVIGLKTQQLRVFI